MNAKLFILLLLSITIKSKGDKPSRKQTDQCLTEMNSFRTLLNLASQLVNLQQANCSERKNVTASGIQKKENETKWATKEDMEEIKKELKLIHDLFRDYGDMRTFYPKDCQDLYLKGYKKSKVYTIFPKNGLSFQVYCDQERDGGGWTVIQRRQDGSENFYRTWNDYEQGFGNLSYEFWLGNDRIHIMTGTGKYKLLINMEDFSGNTRYASYKTFKVGDKKSGYVLNVSGYRGTAGDSLTYHNNMKFATKDRDHNSCAKNFKGSWWYNDCHQSNLNGLYLKGKQKSDADGVNWKHWKGYFYSLKFTEMKIRKLNI
ncbi:fibrinogen C domain-containing protein 1-like [Saccostrea cucullata]|uniref:fibrinogen C domain-containing protein 1-like n=1 Tax=Saccostrea cuccullata TaxID=36930 RepID=UPI002ED5A758